MTRTEKIIRGSALFGTLCLFLSLMLNAWKRQHISAMEFHEVKPYAFAELPHGRIYKTVHEGCELYIVETDNDSITSSGHGFNYSIAVGRGCK